MTSIKTIYTFLKKALLGAAYSEIRTKRIVAFQLAKQRLDELAYHSEKSGVEKSCADGKGELIVSLTTHGKRIHVVHRAIESIFQQSVQVSRVVLYLSDKEYVRAEQLPIALQCQMKRGLEVRFVKDQGPYTKLLPALREYSDANIITIDDDILYSVNMIERLLKAHDEFPDSICALATPVLEWEDGNKLKSFYQLEYEYPECPKQSVMYVAEGFGGVLYPPHSLPDEVFNSSVFSRLAPTADDLWFKAMGLLKGTGVVAASMGWDVYEDLIVDEDVQTMGLIQENKRSDVYDRQFRSLLEHYNLYDKLR